MRQAVEAVIVKVIRCDLASKTRQKGFFAKGGRQPWHQGESVCTQLAASSRGKP